MQLITLPTGSARLCGLVLATLLSLTLCAQQTSEKSLQLEAMVSFQDYRLFDRLSVDQSNGFSATDIFETVPTLGFGAGVRVVNPRNWYTRIGLVNLSLNEATDLNIQVTTDSITIANSTGLQNTLFNLHLRFERGKYFTVGKNLTFGLGVMIDPVFSRRTTRVLSARAFPANLTAFRLDVGVVPSVAVRLAKRASLVLEAPLPLVRTSYRTRFTDNPFLPEDERRESNFETDLFHRMFQVAAGVRFNL